ncbi:hypothetical protein J2S74_000032 [Evansella vedderi]|uniref:Uncharacterized protein n=1 Tax=Evansella vedderi TaxID=38282 RepID=A0ABT9ZN60_9BACI|nr:hypothetical protein [Evansella vedderi]MDQ0252660.1 hypothetical protein [Evansella vedderi]
MGSHKSPQKTGHPICGLFYYRSQGGGEKQSEGGFGNYFQTLKWTYKQFVLNEGDGINEKLQNVYVNMVGVLFAIAIYMNPRVRHMEREIPDAIIDEEGKPKEQEDRAKFWGKCCL